MGQDAPHLTEIRAVPSSIPAPQRRLPPPSDDVVTCACPVGDRSFLASGVDGWVYAYEWRHSRLGWKFRAHRKSVNVVAPLASGDLLTASSDATISLWHMEDWWSSVHSPRATLPSEIPPLSQSFMGHEMSVTALEVLPGADQLQLSQGFMISGSRDCSVQAWDLQTARVVNKSKILRNVVLGIKKVPHMPKTFVQTSEDLALRLWDVDAGFKPAITSQAGANQLVSADVSDCCRYVICGSKGFSRENCTVKVFDLRMNLKHVHSAPVAEQSIEAVRVISSDRCLVASKDGFVRTVLFPEVTTAAEWGPTPGSFTAMCAFRGKKGIVGFAASAGPDGCGLDILAWDDDLCVAAPLRISASY